jgi:hypothetical protein
METVLCFDEQAFRVAMARVGVRSVSHLARLAGLSESYARQIAHGLVPSRIVRERLAGLLAVAEGDVWRSWGGAISAKPSGAADA